MNDMPLHKRLSEYCNEDILPMHMPGGKRREGSLASRDITEINGFDDLHAPSGVIRKLEEDLASLWNAKEAILSVNGATAMIESAICASMRYCPDNKILAASNCHLSVWHGIEMSGCMHSFVDPVFTDLPFPLEITPSSVEEALIKDPLIRTVVITSPTYEGVVSDTKTIYEITQKHDCTLIVDCAHGAHMGLDEYWGDDAVGDIVIKSTHKTLSSPTQTAVLLKYSDRVKTEDIRHYVDIFESSSPSYVLMSGMSEMVELLQSEEPMCEWKKAVSIAEEKLSDLKNTKLFRCGNKDRSKFVLLCNGNKVSQILREEYRIEVEASFDTHLIAMSGIGDSVDSLQRFADAVISIDRDCTEAASAGTTFSYSSGRTQSISLAEAARKPQCSIPVQEAAGRTAAEFIYKYPPGIPVVMPGELLTDNSLKYLADNEREMVLITQPTRSC